MALLLTILKIIGTVLLCLLIFLLVVLLLALFCPAVYRIKGEKQERMLFYMRISWLFPLIYGKIKYEEQLSCILYLLGIPVYDVLGGKQKKKEKPDKKKRKQRTVKKKQEGKKQEGRKEPEKQEDSTKIEYRQVSIDEMQQEPKDLEQVEATESEEVEEKISLFQKIFRPIKEFIQKVKLFIQKVFEKVRNIKYTILNMKEKLENLKETISWYKEVLEREESRRAIAKGKKQILKFLKHISPKKVKGNILFGFGDPGATGEALGFISMFYPVFGNHITVIPDFERTIFQGDFFLIGRIRVFNLLKLGWSILFDKDIKNLYNILTGGKNHE
ncbi:MAG: DUF2953 domain-containing protein [Lachnospiraceae bacterium]|nr:DUF2953 domain-containing protein [Lachnospiraceae bacterium]